MQATLSGRPKYFELIDGRRYAKVSPQRTHSLLQSWLVSRIAASANDRGETGTEWKFYLGGKPGLKNALQADVSFVSYERLRALTPAQREKPHVAPDVAIEILSPDDRPGLLRTKIPRYLGKGSAVVIVVNPLKRTVTAHTSKAPQTYYDGDTFCSDAAAWLEFDVAELFAAADFRG